LPLKPENTLTAMGKAFYKKISAQFNQSAVWEARSAEIFVAIAK
jgi:hypothetical protein